MDIEYSVFLVGNIYNHKANPFFLEWSFINDSLLYEKVEPVHSFDVENALGYTFSGSCFPPP